MVIVKEGLRGKNPEAKVTYGTKVNAKMTGNANFPDAVDVLAALGLATDLLDKSIKDPLATAKSVNEKVVSFNVKMKAVIANVQGVINEVADVVALEMVESAGLEASKKGTINITDLSAKQGKAAKSLSVRKLAGKNKGVIYRFQICLDPAKEENWSDVRISKRATIVVLNLISGTRYYFRVAIIKGDVQEAYSDYISIIVS